MFVGDAFPLAVVSSNRQGPATAMLLHLNERLHWWEAGAIEPRRLDSPDESVRLLSAFVGPLIRLRLFGGEMTAIPFLVQVHRSLFGCSLGDDSLIELSMLRAMVGADWEEVAEWN